MVLYTHSHVQGNQGNVRSNIMCTYSQSRASKEVSETYHMYLLMVTCNEINELLVVSVTQRLLADQVIDSSQDKLFCLAGFTYSQQIAGKAIAAKGKKTSKEMVPKQYRDFAKVFSKEESQHLPQHQLWDHAIDLEPDCHGRCISLSLIFYFERHVTVGYFT